MLFLNTSRNARNLEEWRDPCVFEESDRDYIILKTILRLA